MRAAHRRGLGLGCALLISACWASAQDQPALRVCLPQDSAPHASSTGAPGQGLGLDHALLSAAAARIGRAVQPVWFDSRYDKEGHLSLEARALLAAQACELVAGIPLYAPHLAPMIADKARTPDYPGAPPLRQRPWQSLVPVVGGAAYRATALVLIARDAQDVAVASLDAVGGRAVAVRAGSMASLALGGWRGGALAASIRGLNLHEDVLGAVAAGQADFALVDLALWDRWRALHPATTLVRTGFDHPVKFNIGLLARATDEALLRDMGAALDAAQTSGSVHDAAQAAGATWVAPVLPAVRPSLSLRDFMLAGS